MQIISSIEKMANDIGYDIGMSSDVVQSDLLNGFCKAIHDSMREYNRGGQICYIVKKLDDKSKIILREIVGYIDVAEGKA